MKLLRRSRLSMVRNSFLSKSTDDELSVASQTSTLTVDRTPEKQAAGTSASSSSFGRRVDFDETSNIHYTNVQMDREEIKQLWSTGSEMRQFKAQTAFLAKEINRAEKANIAPFSYQRVVLGAYDACCRMQMETDLSPLTESERKHFDKWMEVSVSRIGLERVCIREMAKDKYARRAHVVDAVLEVQDSLLPGARGGDEIMREAAIAISRPSRLFARELAKAQAANLQ